MDEEQRKAADKLMAEFWPFNRAPDPKRDWIEDFEHENGKYECRCCNCGMTFIGHKRRVVCGVCGGRSTSTQ